MLSFAPIRCSFFPKVFLGLFFVPFTVAEVALWKNSVSEFREDGSCWLIDQSKGTLPPKTVYGSSSNTYCPCDPKYELMRQCQMATFYRDKLPQESEVTKTDDGTALLLVDGRLQCPAGDAEANIQLINALPSGSWFSGCDEQRIVISVVNASVNAILSQDGVEKDGTFSLGGILRERECGGFFGIGKAREGTFHSLMLEISHNCGRKKPMLLKVKFPKINIPAIKARGKMAELKGISVDLGISGGGWNQKMVDYERVRPKQTVPEQTPNQGRADVQSEKGQAEEQREEAKEKHSADESNSADQSMARNASPSTDRPHVPAPPHSPPPSDEKKEGAIFAPIPPALLQSVAIVSLFVLLLLLGCFVRCFLRRPFWKNKH